MHDSCMATKTISIELDVYNRLATMKRSSRESFSQVIRRAKWDSEATTGSSILDFYKSKEALSDKDLDSLDQVQKSDLPLKDKWHSS